jgi:hypothetical protein
LSITIRAVGQASRRGPTHRVPHADALLTTIDEWIVEHAATTGGHTLGRRTSDGAIEVGLHPAARPVRFETTDTGGATVRAMTIPVGPGYHTYVAGLIRRLGGDAGIAWTLPPDTATAADAADGEVSTDPTGAFLTGQRQDAERGHLAWLRSSLIAVRDARRQGASGLHLATPPGVRYTFDGAVATVLGPRDDDWVERALADPRIAVDIWPWYADATDARFHLGRALTLLWNDVRWRPPVGTPEVAVLDDLLATLRYAYPLEPGLPWPWAAWREAFELRGHNDPSTYQLLQRAATAAPEGDQSTAIGYRRRPVTILQDGWAIDLPGSFTDARTEDGWTGSDAARTVTLSGAPTTVGDRPMTPSEFLDTFSAELGPDAVEHHDGRLRGRARISSDASTGVEVGRLDGYSAVPGSAANVRIDFEDPDDWKWALDTWRGLRPA